MMRHNFWHFGYLSETCDIAGFHGTYPRILIVSYLSYQFRRLLENSAGQVIQLRDIPSFYDVIGESVRKTTCNRFSLQLIVNIGGKHVNYL